MKLALSGIAAAVMLAVLPAAQAADSGQGGRQARQQQRVAQSGTTTQSPRTFASRSGDQAGNTQGWNRGRSGSTVAGGGTTTTTTTTGTTGGTTAGTSGGHRGGQHAGQSAQHNGWNQGGQVERHAQYDGRHNDNGRHFGWENGRHNGWNNNHDQGRGNGRHYGWNDHRGNQSNINQREAFQRNRIAQGVRSGELTRGEARSLQSEQRRIENIERDYRSDGRFTREERADIERRLDRSGRHIYQETHDSDQRF
jgi:hypothetical protein